MGAGLSLRNESPLPLGVVLSRITPEHWNDRAIRPGETWNARNEHGVAGSWFVVSVAVFDRDDQPCAATLCSRMTWLALGAAATPLGVGFVAAAAVSAASSSYLWPRRILSRLPSPRNHHVAAAASPRPVSVEYPHGLPRRYGVACKARADGRTLVVRGCLCPRTGEYRLYFRRADRRQGRGDAAAAT